MRQHGVEDGQKLLHTRRQGHFFDLPRREEPFVKGCDLRVVTRGHAGAHGEHGARGLPRFRADLVGSPGRHCGVPRQPTPPCAGD
jgi:hypothetical protein